MQDNILNYKVLDKNKQIMDKDTTIREFCNYETELDYPIVIERLDKG